VKTLSILLFSAVMLYAGCAPNNVTEDNRPEKYFKENAVQGCFGMFDNGKGSFTIYNSPGFRDSAYVPASTFKIINSLIGLETGRAADTNTVFKWNGQAIGREECDRDISMAQAFRFSCLPWYRELARRIGKDTMQHWLDTLGYAKRYKRFVIQNDLDSFWLNNTAKITADEQLGIVKMLYFDQLPFQKRTQRMVRGMMLQESNANYKLSYKTGWGFTENGHAIGWIVGWIEENMHPYFFVLQLEAPDRQFNMMPVRIKILKQILKEYGFMEGKK
jgi:beta-lactamase class D